jgi:hypothetical protein
VSGYFLYPKAANFAAIMYWQHRLMSFSMGPYERVYEEEHPSGVPVPNGSVMVQPWSTVIDQSAGHIVWRLTSLRWCSFTNPNALMLRPNGWPPPVVYVHARAAPGGEERLVYVRLKDFAVVSLGMANLKTEEFRTLHGFDWIVFRPMSPLTPAAVMAQGSWNDNRMKYYHAGALVYYAGQNDSADKSHFSIRFSLPQGEGKIDGWLLTNDLVRFQLTMPGGGVTTQPDNMYIGIE